MKNKEMLVKDFKPKYEMIEAMLVDRNGNFVILGIFKWATFIKEYGKHYIFSTKNYNDTKTTSIIISKEEREII